MASKTFTRLTVPDQTVNRVIQDIYDHLAAPQESTAPSTPATPTTPTQTTLISIQGASGQAAGPQYSFVPQLSVLPSNNPTTGLPYTQNGLLIEVNNQLWRYAAAPIYQWEQAGTATAILNDTHANRVANYPPASYPNGLFLESDTLLLLESDAVTWRTLAGTVRDTHANRLTTWPSVQFSPNTPFFETDRTVAYTVQNASGTVTVAGGVNVTWTAGHHFINTGTGFTAAQWPVNTPIVIAGITYAVSVVNTATSLTLVVAAVNGAGQAYSVDSGRWVYQSGEYAAPLASLPTDLGENDTTLVSTKVALGFLYYENSVYAHQLQWNVSAWQRGPHDEEHSDTFHEFGAAPTSLGWQACDGSAVNYLRYDGTTASRTVPNSNATPSYSRGGNAYSATITAASPPTISGQTEDTLIGFTGASPATASAGTAAAGAGQAVLTALTSGGGGGSLGTDPHHHLLTSANAPISLPGDPVPYFSIVRMYRR